MLKKLAPLLALGLIAGIGTDLAIAGGLMALIVAGLWIGDANHEAKAPAICDVPAGEKLISIEQLKDGVYCNYARAYGRESIEEGYHCRYGVSSAFAAELEQGDLRVTGWDEEGEIRAVELVDDVGQHGGEHGEGVSGAAAIVDRDVQPFVFPGPEKPLSPPMIVLEELDGHKKRMTEVARNGRQASRTLDEIVNDITKATPACFEPTIDYCVVKVPRFAFEKFKGTDPTLTTRMKAVGEIMAIGRTFEEAFGKAMRSLEDGHQGICAGGKEGADKLSDDELAQAVATPTEHRIFFVVEALRRGWDIAVQDGVDRLRDRHVDTDALGQSRNFARRADALGHVTEIGKNLRQLLAFCQRQANLAVARQVTGTGQQQIAHAGQPHEGFRLAAQGDTQTRDFGQTARHQRGAGVEPEAEPIAYPGRDGHDIFDRPADLGTGQIVVGVDAKTRTVQLQRHAPGKIAILRRQRNRQRQAFGNFLGKARPGQNTAWNAVTELLRHNLMRQQSSLRLQSLAHPEQRLHRTGLAQGTQRRPETDERRGDDQEIRTIHCRLEIGRDVQRFRERVARQKTPVLPMFLHVPRDVFLTRPQSDLVPRAERNRQRRPPRPSGDDRQIQT
mgnify:CR=1 FL=1